MKYVFRLLDDVVDINNFNEVNELNLERNAATEIFFMLKTINSNNRETRFIPVGTPITVTVKFRHLDSNLIINRTALLPFADDKSIYKVPLAANEKIMMNTMEVNVKVGVAPTYSFDQVFKPVSHLTVTEDASGKFFC